MKELLSKLPVITACIVLSVFAFPSQSQVWSPDGKQIAFFYLHAIEDIYVVNADGTDFTIVDQHPERDFAMDWSPDGKSLIFTSVRDGHHELYHKKLGSKKLMQLTSGKFNNEDAHFSPDGKKIVFTSDRDGNNELYIMALNTGKVERVTNTPDFKEVAPRWSPDGTALLFVGSEGEADWDVWKCDPDGTNRVNLTNTPSRGEFHPAWSPKGDMVSYVTVVEGAFEIHVTALETGNDRILVRKPGYQAFFPSWSPDGKYIAFTRDVMEGTAENLPALYVTDLEGEERLVTTANSFHLYDEESD